MTALPPAPVAPQAEDDGQCHRLRRRFVVMLASTVALLLLAQVTVQRELGREGERQAAIEALLRLRMEAERVARLGTASALRGDPAGEALGALATLREQRLRRVARVVELLGEADEVAVRHLDEDEATLAAALARLSLAPAPERSALVEALGEAADRYVGSVAALVVSRDGPTGRRIGTIRLLALGFVCLIIGLLVAQALLSFLPAWRAARAQHAQVRAARDELAELLLTVRRLEGLLPICMHCKSIRDEGSAWHPLDRYVSQRAEVRFSHTVCDGCLEKFHPE